MKSSKLTGNIREDQDYLILEAVADSAFSDACNEISERLNQKATEILVQKREELAKELCAMAEEHYKAQVDQETRKFKRISCFYSISSATEFRDWHHTFMRHWLALLLVTTHRIVSRDAVISLAKGDRYR